MHLQRGRIELFYAQTHPYSDYHLRASMVMKREEKLGVKANRRQTMNHSVLRL